MNHSALVRVLQRFPNLLCVVEGRLDGQRSGWRIALDQLHHQRALFHTVDMRNVGMIQRRKHLRFARKTRHSIRVVGKVFGQDLDGDVASELGVVGAIHFTHTTFAELRGDAVMRDSCVDHFFKSASQLTTTFKYGADAGLPLMLLIRNCFPSALTSYSNWGVVVASMCASNSGSGAPARKESLGSVIALTATDINFPSAPTKNSSLPSPRHRGCSPPAMEILF